MDFCILPRSITISGLQSRPQKLPGFFTSKRLVCCCLLMAMAWHSCTSPGSACSPQRGVWGCLLCCLRANATVENPATHPDSVLETCLPCSASELLLGPWRPAVVGSLEPSQLPEWVLISSSSSAWEPVCQAHLWHQQGPAPNTRDHDSSTPLERQLGTCAMVI